MRYSSSQYLGDEDTKKLVTCLPLSPRRTSQGKDTASKATKCSKLLPSGGTQRCWMGMRWGRGCRQPGGAHAHREEVVKHGFVLNWLAWSARALSSTQEAGTWRGYGALVLSVEEIQDCPEVLWASQGQLGFPCARDYSSAVAHLCPPWGYG